MEFQSGAVRPVGSIEDGWNLIKDDYWTFFGMTLVGAIITIVVALILGAVNNAIVFGVMTAMGAATSGANDAAKFSAAILPQVVALFIQIFTSILLSTLSGVLFCGIYTALARKASGAAADFGDLFSGFQKIVPCLVAAVLVSVLQFVVSFVILVGGAAVGFSAVGLGGLVSADGKLNPAAFSGLLVFALVFFAAYLVMTLIVSALTTFIYPLIADRDLSGGAAILLSIKSGFANLGGLILLLLLLGLMLFGGALVCLVGMFFVLPIMSAALFAAYQSVFGRTNAGGNYNYAPPPPPTFNNQPGY